MENHRFLIFVSHQLMYESRWKNMTKMTMGIGYRLRQDCRDAQKKSICRIYRKTEKIDERIRLKF